ncbi:MAG: MarR family transcriptional regulator [Gemmatimonadaceae bacterium]
MSDSKPREIGPVLEFLRLLWRVNHGMEKRSKRMQSGLGVTAPQRMVVRMVGRFPGIYAGDLAALLHVDRGTLSSALRRLEAAGVLTRTADAVDRRRVAIHLTNRGKRIDAHTDGTIESAVKGVVAGESNDSIRGAQRVLAALAKELERAPRRSTTSKRARRS